MSYLSLPRLNFSGQFQVDASPVNDDARHFGNSGFTPKAQETPLSDGLKGRRTADYIGAFQLLNTTVKSALTVAGSADTDAAAGLYLTAQSQRTTATLVDLDPQIQMGPVLWGLTIVLTDGEQQFMRADCLPAASRDIRFAGDEKQSAIKFTSLLTNVAWPAEAASSDVLSELRKQAQLNGNRLSINLMTYDYSSTNSTGNLVGSIGAWSVGQPERFVLGRRFAVAAAGQTVTPAGIGFFDAQVSDTVSLDLGNALPLTSSSGQYKDLNSISAVVLKAADKAAGVGTSVGSITAEVTQDQEIDSCEFELLGEVPYRDQDWLTKSAGIVDFSIPATAVELIHNRPLALVSPSATPGKFKVLIRETIGGLSVRADQCEFRVDALAKKDVIVDATLFTAKYGKPTGGYVVDLSLAATEPNQGHGAGDANPPIANAPGTPFIGLAAEALAFTGRVVTDSDGCANFPVRVSNPGNSGSYCDGQIYKIAYDFSIDGTSPLPLTDTLVLHARGAYIPPASPTWNEHVAPIMRQYGSLYASMSKALFGSTDHQSIEKYAKLLMFAFEQPLADPAHLPATRDLSSGKRQTILAYLDNLIPGKKSPVFAALSKHRIADSYAADRIPGIPTVLLSVVSAQESLVNSISVEKSIK